MGTDCIVEGNKAAPNNNSTIKKFTILPHDFSVEGGELTSTLKLKRSVTLQHFQEVPERTYDPALGRDPYVPFNPSGGAVDTKTEAAAAATSAAAVASEPVQTEEKENDPKEQLLPKAQKEDEAPTAVSEPVQTEEKENDPKEQLLPKEQKEDEAPTAVSEP